MSAHFTLMALTALMVSPWIGLAYAGWELHRHELRLRAMEAVLNSHSLQLEDHTSALEVRRITSDRTTG